MSFIIVFLGAGIGGTLRHGVNLIAAQLVGTAFPAGTMFINIVGSLAMAVLAETFALRVSLPQETRLFLTTGVLGGFTTFSAFSLETIMLWERGQGGSPQPIRSVRWSPLWALSSRGCGSRALSLELPRNPYASYRGADHALIAGCFVFWVWQS